jgi:hypothetical protein
MFLLNETTEDVEYLTEEVNGAKKYTISGRFMVAEERNGNGRVYPRSVLENQVNKYQQAIKENRSMGELNHPMGGPTLNLDKVSHLITELKMDGNIAYGKARLMETPMGKIAKTLINEGVRLGVSSRGLGSIKESNGLKIVQPDFNLVTVDIVATPSAPGAYMEAIIENQEWIFDGLEWKRQETINEQIREIKNTKDRQLREEKFLKAFEQFFK